MASTITQPIRTLRRSQDITVRCLPPKRARERTPNGVHSLEVVPFGDFVHVTGALPLRSRHRNPVQYRVLVSEGRDDHPMSSDSADRIVGASAAGNLLAPTLIGRMQRKVPFRSLDVIIGAEDTDDQGWIDLPAIARDRVARDRFMASYLERGEFERLHWKPDGALATIDVSTLAADVEWLVVRVEVREVVHRATGTTRPMGGNGRTALVRVDRRGLDESGPDVSSLIDARAMFAAAL